MEQLDFDLNNDKKVSDEEVAILTKKMATQRKMAWIAIWSIVVVTLILVSPGVADSRVDALGELLGLFYISMAGIVGAYMGVTLWMNKK